MGLTANPLKIVSLPKATPCKATATSCRATRDISKEPGELHDVRNDVAFLMRQTCDGRGYTYDR